jgi:Flp pilus assembly pilin Flp
MNTIISLYIAVVNQLQALFAPRQVALVHVRRTRRAATFIEYALLAGVAVVVITLFRGQLSSFMSSMVDKINGAL